MKTLQQTLATILLALVLGISAHAGDMGGPSSMNSCAPLPTDGIPAVTTTSPPQVPGETNPPVLTELVLKFLVSALSMY
jgi:hypothetical protein